MAQQNNMERCFTNIAAESTTLDRIQNHSAQNALSPLGSVSISMNSELSVLDEMSSDWFSFRESRMLMKITMSQTRQYQIDCRTLSRTIAPLK